MEIKICDGYSFSAQDPLFRESVRKVGGLGQGVVGKKTLQRSMLRTGQQISPDSVGMVDDIREKVSVEMDRFFPKKDDNTSDN